MSTFSDKPVSSLTKEQQAELLERCVSLLTLFETEEEALKNRDRLVELFREYRLIK